MRETAVVLRKVRFPGKRSRRLGDRLLHEAVRLRRDAEPSGILYRRQAPPCVLLQLLDSSGDLLLFCTAHPAGGHIVDAGKELRVPHGWETLPCVLPLRRLLRRQLHQRLPLAELLLPRAGGRKLLRGLDLRVRRIVPGFGLVILCLQGGRVLAADLRDGDLPGEVAHLLLCRRGLLAQGRAVGAGGRGRRRLLRACGGSRERICTGAAGRSAAGRGFSGRFLPASGLRRGGGRGGQDGPLRILLRCRAVDIGLVGPVTFADGDTAVGLAPPCGAVRCFRHIARHAQLISEQHTLCGADLVLRDGRLLDGLIQKLVAGRLVETGRDVLRRFLCLFRGKAGLRLLLVPLFLRDAGIICGGGLLRAAAGRSVERRRLDRRGGAGRRRFRHGGCGHAHPACHGLAVLPYRDAAVGFLPPRRAVGGFRHIASAQTVCKFFAFIGIDVII